MAWQTPITNRTSTNKGYLDYIMLNRIEENCKYLEQQLKANLINIEIEPYNKAAKTITGTNIIQNASFENDFANWTQTAVAATIDTSVVYHGAKSFKIDCTAQNKLYDQNFTAIVGHKYYVAYRVDLQSVTNGSAMLEILLNGTIKAALRQTAITNGFILNSAIFTADHASGIARIGTWYSAGATINANIDACFLMDMSTMFNELNEPTQAWLDANVNYFDGTSNIIIEPAHDIWVEKDYPFLNQISRIRSNINILKNAYYHTGIAPDIIYHNSLDWNDANALEQNLLNLNTLLQNMIAAFNFSGTFAAGQEVIL